MQRPDGRQFHHDPALKLLSLEPLAAISHPPGDEDDGDSGGDSPPQGEKEIRQHAENEENHPEDFSFHKRIVSPIAGPFRVMLRVYQSCRAGNRKGGLH